MLERDRTFNDIWDRIERLEGQIEDLRDMSRPTDVVVLEGEWQSFAGWVSDGTVLQDVNGQIILNPSEPCILIGEDGYIQSQDYVPGISGWRIDGTGADLVDVEIPTVAPAFTFGTAAAEGVADTFVRSDAKLAIFDANNPVQIDAGDGASPGAAGVAARRDHAHAVNSTSDGQTNPNTLLQADANGYLRLARVGIGASPTVSLDIYAASAVVARLKGVGDTYAYTYIELWSDEATDRKWSLQFRKDTYAGLLFQYYDGSSYYHPFVIRDRTQANIAFYAHGDGQLSIGHTTQYGFLDVRQHTVTGPTINAYRNLAAGSTDSPVLRVVQDHAGDDQYAAYISGDGAADTLVVASGHASARAAQFSRNVATATTPVVYIAQSNPGGVDGCLHLYQNDVDQHFIEFQSAASSGDLTRAIVDEGDQASEVRRGWLKIFVTDAGGQVSDDDYFVPFYALS